MSEQLDSPGTDWTPALAGSVHAPTLAEIAADDPDDVEALHEQLFHQRQTHAVEVRVLQKRLDHAIRDRKRSREGEELAKWELQRIRHATRGELRHHVGRIADLLTRNERLEVLLALPWWALIRRFQISRTILQSR
jgi:hypothetical protein